MNNILLRLLQARNGGGTNEELVASLKESNALTNPRIEEAMLKIPRGEFVSEDLLEEAYMDCPIRVASMGFNISAPHMYAVCLENLNIEPGMSFLDIGSGCGHFTALGSFLVGKDGISHGIEIRQDIVEFAQNNLKKFEAKSGMDFSNVKFYLRNCFLPVFNPLQYDRIHVGACCPEAKLKDLVTLLKPNGVLVTPLLDKMVRVTKSADGKSHETKFLMAVRYGDLIVPSDAEIKDAERQADRQRRTTIIIPENTFLEDFSKLFNNEHMSDVKIVVEGKPIFGHRVILGARSDYFRQLFANLESNSNSNSNTGEVSIPGVSYPLALECLKYMYSGTLVLRNPEHASEILEIANLLKLAHLKASCEEMIKDSANIENAASIFQLANRLQALQLKSYAMTFIMEHYEDVAKTKAFDELDKTLIVEITREACKYAKEEL